MKTKFKHFGYVKCISFAKRGRTRDSGKIQRAVGIKLHEVYRVQAVGTDFLLLLNPCCFVSMKNFKPVNVK